jgi:PAS domain S-box-containing protein
MNDPHDRLMQFFSVLASLHQPDNADKAFDLMLHFCRQLGYSTAMLSLIDRDAEVVRAVRAVGELSEIVGRTIRPLGGSDILALVAREGKSAVVADAQRDPRCDQSAAAAAGVRGLIVVPLISGEVVGTLQVASRDPIHPAPGEVRALEALAGEAAQALAVLRGVARIRELNRQMAERNERLEQLAADLEEIAAAERRTREALWASQERLHLLLESSGEGIYGIDLEGQCTFINRAAAEMLGCSLGEANGQNMHFFLHHSRPDGSPYPVEECPIFQAFRTGTSCRIDTEVFWRRDGTCFPVEYTAFPIRSPDGTTSLSDGPAGSAAGPSDSSWGTIQGAVVTFTDITQRKRAEEALRRQNVLLQELARSEHQAHEAMKRAQSQLVQSEKLAALGQLVAGVAHEINNPLSFVGNNVAVLQRDVAALGQLLVLYREAEPLLAEQRPELRQRITDLAERIDLQYTLDNLGPLMARSRDGLKRIQQIVKDLRDFARLDESDLQEADINAGVESTVNIIRSRAKKQGVEIVLDLGQLPHVSCYPAKVNQVVLNLVANSIDACGSGGKVTVRTAASGDGVVLHVLDTGRGIPPEIRERVFDPFFTTKPPGQGTGLGLSVSYQIVQDHRGSINFDCPPGGGTHFVVWLPLRGQRRAAKGQS